MKVILSNDTELTAIVVNGARRDVQNANRDTLDIVLPSTYSVDEIDNLFNENNCEILTIIDGSKENIYNGYTVRAGLSKDKVKVQEADPITEAIYEDRITVSMSQRTYTETQLASLVKSQADQDEIIAELMFGGEM